MNLNELVTWYRRRRVRSAFMEAREDVYEKMIEELEKHDAKRTETLSALFGAWATREARRKKWLAIGHGSIASKLNSEGKTLSEALAYLIPFEERMVIWAGEQNGQLVDSLHHALRIKATLQEMKGNAAAATLQPIYWGFNVSVTSLVMGVYVWPTLVVTIPLKYWPAWAVPSISFDLWFASNWPVFGLIGLALGAYYYSLPRWTGRARQIADRFFPWAAYREEQSNIFLTTLAGLVRNKFTIPHACEEIRAKSTPYLRWHLNRMVVRIPQAGENPLSAFDTGLISRPVMDRLQDAKRTRDLDKTIEHVGDKSLQAMVKIAKRFADRTSLIVSSIFVSIFFYSAAVQLVASQQASETFTRSTQQAR